MSKSLALTLVLLTSSAALRESWAQDRSHHGGPRGSDCQFPRPEAAAALPNDNRTPAGFIRDGVLDIRLAVRLAGWYPEGSSGCGLPAFAFAEEGKQATIPGPLLRVAGGTEIRATVRNELAEAIRITGLQDHGQGQSDTTTIAPGGVAEFRFRVTEPGTFFYRALLAEPLVPGGPDLTRQLVGGFIVDPPGPVPEDRVFVITRWRKFVPNPVARSGEPGFPAGQRVLGSINGLSWPHTERLLTTVGQTLRWRVINADVAAHPLHLHGFYFRVLAHGSMASDTAYDAAERRMAVTEPVFPWGTMTIEWSPDRPGNWLFHCHMVAHIGPRQRLHQILAEGLDPAVAIPADRSETANSSNPTGHAHEMAGLILGIKVGPVPAGQESDLAPMRSDARKFRLFLQRKERVFGDGPGYGFVLQEGSRAPARDSIRIPGPELALTRGEPVEVTVINRGPIPLSVHWHGIELDSYFDGVAGWSGDTRKLAPPIAPEDSFVVRFTPPRAGTFIYHVHDEGGTELASGLYGPLIVRERGTDPVMDHVFLVSDAGPGLVNPPFVNGTTTPDTLELVAGKTYRLRLISIGANATRFISLSGSAGQYPWQRVARDGWDHDRVPEASLEPARLGPGMTADYQVTPAAAGNLTLTAVTPLGQGRFGTPTIVPIRVRNPKLGAR